MSYSTSNNDTAQGVPVEEFSFNFEEIKVTYDDARNDTRWIPVLSIDQTLSRPIN